MVTPVQQRSNACKCIPISSKGEHFLSACWLRLTKRENFLTSEVTPAVARFYLCHIKNTSVLLTVKKEKHYLVL